MALVAIEDKPIAEGSSLQGFLLLDATDAWRPLALALPGRPRLIHAIGLTRAELHAALRDRDGLIARVEAKLDRLTPLDRADVR